jgi:hypothetical protein
VSANPPEATEPPDPALEVLIRALTADGTAGELAARPAALAMFRDRFTAGRRHPRRLRSAFSRSTAAAAIALAAGIAAAYAAVLPPPVQHIAYRALGSIGVPDTHRPGPPSRAVRSVTPVRSTPSARASAGCPCPASRPGTGTGPNLVMTVAQAQIPAGGDVVLSGRVAPAGRPEAGVRVRLFERLAGRPGWRAAGSAVTDHSGDVTWTLPHLTGDAAFWLAVPGAGVSAPVLVTVIPAVHLGVAAGQQPGMAVLTARAPFAQAGDAVVLQERSEGIWYRVGERVLDRDHLASFRVLVPLSGGVQYRAILVRTTTHGSSVSGSVWIASRPAARVRPGRRAPP